MEISKDDFTFFLTKMPRSNEIFTKGVTKLETDNVNIHYAIAHAALFELEKDYAEGIDDELYHNRADAFFKFSFENFKGDLMVLVAKKLTRMNGKWPKHDRPIWNTTYKLFYDEYYDEVMNNDWFVGNTEKESEFFETVRNETEEEIEKLLREKNQFNEEVKL